MRKLSVGMLMATMAAVAAEVPAPGDDIRSWKLLPPDGQALTAPERPRPNPRRSLAAELAGQTERYKAQAAELLARSSDSTCYFIGQVNPYLRAPKDKPELLPLAGASPAPPNYSPYAAPSELPSYYVSPNCLTASLVRKPDSK